MGKRPRRTPAEKARAQYTNYAVKEPMELMEFLATKMPDASRTKLKSLLSKRVSFLNFVDKITAYIACYMGNIHCKLFYDTNK